MAKPYNEIENVSDQLDGYAEEAAKAFFTSWTGMTSRIIRPQRQ